MIKKIILYSILCLSLAILPGCSKKESAIQIKDSDIQNEDLNTDEFWNIGDASIAVENEVANTDTSSEELENEDESEDSNSEDPLEEDETADSDNQVEYASEEGRAYNSHKRVICWGDSLTEGTGGDGITMPDTIADMSGAKVLNYGGYGESISCIAARQGGNPQYLVEDIVIPADTTPVKAQPSGKYGYEMLLVFADAGINNVSIAGIEGTYSMDGDGNRMFTRLSPGDAVTVPAGTQLITHAMMDYRSDDIAVIWAGSNDEPQTVDEIPAMLEKMDDIISYHGNNQYVVVSLTSRHSRIPVVDSVNAAYAKRYGEHYLDLRSYFVNEALPYLGITPTEHDKQAIALGDVPFSIRLSDDENENHGNSDFYRLAGEQIYKKLRELGYLK